MPLNALTFKRRILKNNKFTLSDVNYESNIKKNLILTNSILDNGCKTVMEKINSKDHLQILKKNKIIANIYADDESLISFDTIPTNSINKSNQISNIDIML